MILQSEKTLGVLYEHPRWYNPLFFELENRGINYQKVNPLEQQYDPSHLANVYSCVYNDMSGLRFQIDDDFNVTGRGEYISFLETSGVHVVNGSVATAIGYSRTRQVQLLASLKLPFPSTRVVKGYNHTFSAAKNLRFPIVAKPNIGGKGQVKRYNSLEEFEDAIITGSFVFDAYGSAIIQEFVSPKGGYIVRVETLNGRFLYAIKIHIASATSTVTQSDIRLEAFTPTDQIIGNVESIVQNAGIDVGSVEYLISERNNRPYFIDINAHPDYGIEVRNVLGYDPCVSLVNVLEQRAAKVREIELAL